MPSNSNVFENRIDGILNYKYYDLPRIRLSLTIYILHFVVIKLTYSEFITVQASSPGLPYINELSTLTRKFHEHQSQKRTAQKAPATSKIRDTKVTKTTEEKSLDKSRSNADNCSSTGNTSISNIVAHGKNYPRGCSNKNVAKNRHWVPDSSAARTTNFEKPVTVIEPQSTGSTRSNRKDIRADTEISTHRSVNSELFDDNCEEFSAPVVNIDALYSQDKISTDFTESAEMTFEGNISDTESEICQQQSQKLSRKREHTDRFKSVNENTSIIDHQTKSPVTKKSRSYSGSTKRTVKSIVTYSDSDTESNIPRSNKRQKMASSQIIPATKTTESLIVFPEYSTQPTVKSEPLNQGGEKLLVSNQVFAW